jgi:hypothetical protein
MTGDQEAIKHLARKAVFDVQDKISTKEISLIT